MSVKLVGYCIICRCFNDLIYFITVTFSCCTSNYICRSSARSWFAGWTFRWYSKRRQYCRSRVKHGRTCRWRCRSLPLSLDSRCHTRPLYNILPSWMGCWEATRSYLLYICPSSQLVVESKDPACQLLIFDRTSTLDGFCDGSSVFLKLS